MKTISEVKATGVLNVVNSVIGTETPATMQANLRDLMDCFFLNGETDNKETHYQTFKELDRLLGTFAQLAG